MATILVVDDRPSNRQFLTTLLGYGGHRLVEAGDGERALELVRSDRPDLVITDILMPKMDGYEFVQRMRADPDLAAMPVIFYTASYSAPEAATLARKCGVQKVLPKPSEPQDIVAAVSDLLGAQMKAPKPSRQAKPAEVPLETALSVYFKDLEEVKEGFRDLAARNGAAAAERSAIKDLSGKFAENVARMQRITARLSALVEVGMEMISERDPERLVKLFFSAACDLIDSRYAAIGMLDQDEKTFRHILAKGFDAEALRGPAGRKGPLGTLLEGKAVRKKRQAKSSLDLLDGHPPVRDFLGIPVATVDCVYGWLYFADSTGKAEFSEEDERVGTVMAKRLALLYENALLYDEIQRHAAQMQIEVSERRRAQAALARSEAGLQRAQVMAKLAHVVTGPDGVFEDWSATLATLAGVELAGMPRTTREWMTLIHPDDRPVFRERAILSGVTKERNESEYRLRRPGGETIRIRQTTEPIDGGDNGGTVRWFNTLQDVTEERRIAENLRESDRRFSDMLGNVELVSLMLDPDARISYCNDYLLRLTGWQREQVENKNWFDLFIPPEIASTRQVFSDLLADLPAAWHHENEILTRSGERRLIRWNNSVLRSAEGDVIGTASIGEDITEQKRAEVRIKRLNRVYAVLSQINTLIVRVRDRGELFREACAIAIDHGGFRMAWIGVVDREPALVRPVASAGEVGDFFDNAPLAVMESKPGGHGLSGRAVRELKAQVSNDVRKDSQRLMRKELDARGINSLAVIPLIVAGEAVGVLALYATEVGFFDDEEMKLLLELAGDISFALDHLQKTEKINYLAYYDELTGLANRTLFAERLDQMMRDARTGNRKLALSILDVQRFKAVNDAFGRQIGDLLLQEIAARMQAAGKESARMARLGADHFAVISKLAQNEDEIARITEKRVQEVFETPFKIGGHDLRVSARIGIAIFPQDGSDGETLLRSAEAAVKNAKTTGEPYLFFASEMTARVADKLSLENKLRQAVEREEFLLHYQPKVDLETRTVVGVEALIRWQSPDKGLVPPLQFIPLLEETGLILPVGAWALKRAALDHHSWVERNLKPPRVAVNVSAIQLRQRDFVAKVEQAIMDGVAPTAIDLEITESLVMEDIKGNIDKLKAVRDLGVSIAIDDFGTGYSSLAYLAQLPVQYLKIDRSFIIRMQEDPNAMTLVSTMITLAHSLRLKVIAEGVETEEQARFLRLLRCDQMQGYLFSKPLPAEALIKLLEKSG